MPNFITALLLATFLAISGLACGGDPQQASLARIRAWRPADFSMDAAATRLAVACLGNPDPVGMKVYAPAGEETFDDIQTTEEAQAGADRREAA